MSEDSEETVYECLVVGAGIEGSCTARYAASHGKKTLCLEQFPLPHDRGSSHGQSRITRHSYEEPFITCMMPEAFALWNEIEQLAKTKLFINCGYLEIDDYPYTSISNISDNLKSNGIKEELLTSKELKDKYMLNFPNSVIGLLERAGGILLANKCLLAVQDQFVKFGGVLHDNEKVTEIIPGQIVEVKTNKGRYKSKTVVLTPGPWASSLLKPLGVDLPLRPKRLSVFYWKVKKCGFDASSCYPAWYGKILYSAKRFEGYIYTTPCYEYPDLIKICYHDGPDVDPDARDDVDHAWPEQAASEYIARHVIGVETKPSIVEHCMYTVLPDRKCILDRHPGYKNIVMGVGFSGSGFKLSPVFGKILFQLAFGLEPSYDLKHFKVGRFQHSTPKSSL